MESFQKNETNSVDLISNNDPLDKNSLLIEELWESVEKNAQKIRQRD